MLIKDCRCDTISTMKTTITDMLNQYNRRKAIRLHMPGHKGKGTTCNALDITELSFSDNLMNANGVIATSQNIYAKTIGAKCCKYLTGGSTQGVFALVASSVGSILTESNCHTSVTKSAKLLGKQLVAIDCDTTDDLPRPLTVEQITRQLDNDSSISTILLTSPNYYGFACDLKAIYKLAKSRDVVLLVDSAHGAHFGLNKRLPYNAIEYCDACVQSVHKTLGALTQSAVLLANNNKLFEQLCDNANIIATTSPSYLLMSSIEQALDFAVANYKKYNILYNEIKRFADNVQQLGYRVVDTDDFTRLVIDCAPLGYNARAVYSALEKLGIYCELATDRYLVAIVTIYDSGVELDALYTALNRLVVVDSVKWDNSYVSNCFDKK